MLVFIECAIKWSMHIKKQLLAWKTQFIAFSQMRLKKNKKMRQRRSEYRTQIRINRYVCGNCNIDVIKCLIPEETSFIVVLSKCPLV